MIRAGEAEVFWLVFVLVVAAAVWLVWGGRGKLGAEDSA